MIVALIILGLLNSQYNTFNIWYYFIYFIILLLRI